MTDDDTKLAGPAYPPEILEQYPELGQYTWGPWGYRWPETPGMVQMTLAAFIPGKGWLTTKRSVIYGGRHGEPPMLADEVDTLVERLLPELRSGIRAMKHRLEVEDG